MPYRLMYRFWLDMEKPEEELIADKIEHLKNERSFTSVIRDGIRLVCDLREGKLDVLFELFPWVRAEFVNYMREALPNSIEAPKNLQLESQIRADNAQSNQRIENDKAWLEAEKERIELETEWEARRLEEAKQSLETERQKIEDERQRLEAEKAQRQTSIQRQLQRLEKLLLHQGNIPMQSTMDQFNTPSVENNPPRPSEGVGLKAQVNNRGGVGLKGLSGTQKTFPTSSFDDDFPKLEFKKAKGYSVARFLGAIQDPTAKRD